MARVCILGDDDANLRYELLSHETARNALATYDLGEPFANAVGVETVSLGAAVALLNDLNWYLVRYADAAFVLEPSISEEEWLSRELATAVRDDEVAPEETGRYLRVYGVEESDGGAGDDGGDPPADGPRLVEPMLVARTGDSIPEYDLRPVDRTAVVRLAESEFGA